MPAKTILYLLLVLLLGPGSAASLSAAELVFTEMAGAKTAVGAPRNSLGVANTPIVPHGEADTASFAIRCWQNGQLILEEQNWSVPQLAANYIALRKAGTSAPGIYLIDFQHTFCELKQQR